MTMTDSPLVSVLVDLGVDVRKSDGQEISGKCPVHVQRTGKEDGSPSWSMNANTGLWICFSCGARGSLPTLVSELTGKHDVVMEVHGMLIDANLEVAKNSPAVPVENAPLGIDDLVRYRKFKSVPKEQRKRRRLDGDLLDAYGVRWDSDDDSWVIPVMSSLGELLGWQSKSDRFVRNYPKGIKKSSSLFGYSLLTCGSAVLVESPLDVVRFAGVYDRPQALASYGSFVSDYQIRLLSMAVDKLTLAMDNDIAGKKSTRELWKRLPTFRSGLWFFYYGKSLHKDIGDMSSTEIENGVLKSSQLPPWSVTCDDYLYP